MQIDNPLNNKQALYLIWATILNQSQSANSTLDKTLRPIFWETNTQMWLGCT